MLTLLQKRDTIMVGKGIPQQMTNHCEVRDDYMYDAFYYRRVTVIIC